jgi:hypothetical protein
MDIHSSQMTGTLCGYACKQSLSKFDTDTCARTGADIGTAGHGQPRGLVEKYSSTLENGKEKLEHIFSVHTVQKWRIRTTAFEGFHLNHQGCVGRHTWTDLRVGTRSV